MLLEEMFPHTYEGNKRVVAAGGTEFDETKGVEIWRAARTLKDFGAATALWLEGKIGHMPTSGYYSHPNEESMGLLPYINPLNRNGLLVSDFSQPACTPTDRPFGGNLPEQLAAISGFMDKRVVSQLASVVEQSGIVLLVNPPASPAKRSFVTVSRENGEDITFTGNVESTESIANRYTGLHRKVIKALQGSYQVDLYDPEWGRNDRLWPLLSRFYQAASQVELG